MKDTRSYFKTADGLIYRSSRHWSPNDTPLKKAEGQRLYREQAIERLRRLLKPGQTVYTNLRHVSASGMSRRISLNIVDEQGKIQGIDFDAATAMDDTIHKDGGIVVGGCGMDMGYALIYSLGRCLFPDGFKVEGRGRNGDTSGWDKYGGYALKQQWL